MNDVLTPQHVSKTIAKLLLNIKAVSLNPQEPFTWTSGLKSPIYCDNRLIMSYPDERLVVAKAFVQLIEERYKDVDVIAGVATAGIPHAAFIAQLMNKPMVYVRSDAKKHGKKNAIEGNLPKNSKVVIVEDLISTGKSVIQAAKVIEDNGGQILGCCAIFNYLLPVGQEAFQRENYALATLSNYEALIEEALQDESLACYKTLLESWHKDPLAWSNQFQ